jgi:hypothetical protein
LIEWQKTGPRELLAALRPGGAVYGQSHQWPAYLDLSKTDLLRDLRSMSRDRPCVWRVIGNPEESERYAKDRRAVVIQL